ncbi:hypothetical protein [Paracoccus aeridis]|uniref:hypothetical protein n=1 Tax=Paracoccus aeridis TaxID=1966466 RepID=UPI001F32CD8B|nr:hypothetical protein [Paracoccus aeridis]
MTARAEHPMTRAEILEALPDLTDEELDALIRTGAVLPVASAAGPLFRGIDVARLRLILELEDFYALDGERLALVMSLIDQLNGLRGDMRAMLQAVAAEEPETRARLRRVIRETRVTITRED